jgi:hypothetical protein
MDIDKEKLKQFIVGMMANFKELETEIMAPRAVIASLSMMYDIADPEALIEAARNGSTIQKAMVDKYDAPREEFLAQFDKSAEMNEKIVELLRLWTPKGPVV